MPGGRPSNIAIKCSDPELVALLDHIYSKILPSQRDVKDKAKFFSELARSRHFHLAESELRNNIFGPYGAGKNITISRNYITELDSFLRSVKDEFEIDISVVSNFKEKYATEILDSAVGNDSRGDILSLLYKSGPRLNYLENTEWVLFERIGDDAIKDADWGIAVGRISFKSFKYYLNVRMNTVYQTINRTYEGIASQDSQKCLFVDLLKLEDNTRSNIVLQLADSDVHKQDLLIGHYTFYSPSNAYDHILSKTVILLKVHPIPDDKTKSNYLPIGNYNYKSDQYFAISSHIRSFLYSRGMNRMSMPKEAVSNLGELDRFLLSHRLNKINSKLKKHFINDYLVYYKNTAGLIVEDILKIYFDSDAIKLCALYSHSPDVDRKHYKNWVGGIFINDAQSGISLELSNEKSKFRDDQEDPILLSFWIPDWRVTFFESQCYPGVISGLEDSSKGPIAYTCLVVKKNIENFMGLLDGRIEKYFVEHESFILKPKMVKFKLDDL